MMIVFPRVIRLIVAMFLLMMEANADSGEWPVYLHLPILIGLILWIVYLSLTGPVRYFRRRRYDKVS